MITVGGLLAGVTLGSHLVEPGEVQLVPLQPGHNRPTPRLVPAHLT